MSRSNGTVNVTVYHHIAKSHVVQIVMRGRVAWYRTASLPSCPCSFISSYFVACQCKALAWHLCPGRPHSPALTLSNPTLSLRPHNPSPSLFTSTIKA